MLRIEIKRRYKKRKSSINNEKVIALDIALVIKDSTTADFKNRG